MGEQRERRRVVRGLTLRPRSPDIVRVMGLAAQAQFAERAGDDGGARPAESAYSNRRIPSLIRGRPPRAFSSAYRRRSGTSGASRPCSTPACVLRSQSGPGCSGVERPGEEIHQRGLRLRPSHRLSGTALPTVAPLVTGSFAASASISPFAIHGRRHSIGVRYPEATPFCPRAY